MHSMSRRWWAPHALGSGEVEILFRSVCVVAGDNEQAIVRVVSRLFAQQVDRDRPPALKHSALRSDGETNNSLEHPGPEEDLEI